MRSTIAPLLLLATGFALTACNEQSPAEKPAAAAAPVAEVQPATAAPAKPAADLNDPNVLVIVNDDVITAQQFAFFDEQRRQAMGGRGKQSPQQQLEALNELVNFTLLSQEAEAQGLEQDPEVAAMLELLRVRVLAEAAAADHMRKNQPSEEELNRLYTEQFGGKKKQEYKARHILVKTEDEAKAVIAELDKGSDFAKLAEERSTGPSGPQGGDLGWFDADSMVAPFANAVVAMTTGSYSKTPVQTQFGWHVILLEETRELDPPALEEVADQIMRNRQQELMASYLTQLREKSNIQIQPSAEPAEQPQVNPHQQ